MEPHPHQLAPPVDDSKATEIARIWVGKGGEYVSLNPHLHPDPAFWGLMLVDLARHVANALQQAAKMNPATVEREIRRGFDAEWKRPRPSGHDGGLFIADPGQSPFD